jgi:hypothetical protein
MELANVVVGLLDGGLGLGRGIIIIKNGLQKLRWNDGAHVRCASAVRACLRHFSFALVLKRKMEALLEMIFEP